MKCLIKNRFLYFVEGTPSEFEKVREELTWENPDKEDTEEDPTLFFEGDPPFTLYGLLDLIKSVNLELTSTSGTYKTDFEVDPNILKGIVLYHHQNFGVRKCCIIREGIVDVATGGGKTEILLATILHLIRDSLKKKDQVLIIVPSIPIGGMIEKRAIKYGITDVGFVNASRKEFDKKIVIAVINSITSGIKKNTPEVMELLKNTNVLIYDETHHFRAKTYNELILANYCNPDYLFGFSASPFHNPNNPLESYGDSMIKGLFGGVILKVPIKYLIQQKIISNPIIFFKTIPGVMSKYRAAFNKLYKHNIVKNSIRNNLIVKYTRLFNKYNIKPLIIVSQKQHADILLEKLSGLNVIAVFGGSSGRVLDQSGEIIDIPIDYQILADNFDNGVYDVLIATQVFDEGVDLPTIGAVILAAAGKSRIKDIQRLGRGLRLKKDSLNEVFILDFLDRTHIYFFMQYRKRLRGFQEENLDIYTNEYGFVNHIHKNWESRENIK